MHLTSICTKLTDPSVLRRIPELARDFNGRPLGYKEKKVSPFVRRPFENLDRAASNYEPAIPSRRKFAHFQYVLRVLVRVVDLGLDEEISRHSTRRPVYRSIALEYDDRILQTGYQVRPLPPEAIELDR